MSTVLGHFSQPGRRPHNKLDHRGKQDRSIRRATSVYRVYRFFPLLVSCVGMLTDDLLAYG